MDIKERFTDDSSGKYAWLLMFCFICGSLLTLVYLPDGGGAAKLSIEAGAVFASVLLVISAALAVSLCGWLMPAVFIALGVVTVLSAGSAYAEYFADRGACFRRLLLICLTVPLNYVIGVWGMGNSRRICAALRTEDGITRRQHIHMYILMAVVTALAVSAAVILR